jgi:hypothetical protein
VPAACGGGDGKPADGNEATADRPAAERTALGPPADDNASGAEEGDEEAGEASEPGPLPSDFARRTIPRPLLRLYLKAGNDLLLDWWLIAAVDQIDLKAGNPAIPPRERIPGIGYSLAAAGAPHDYHAALAARAGGAYAERALKLAGRYVETVAEQRQDARREGGESSGDDEGSASEDEETGRGDEGEEP